MGQDEGHQDGANSGGAAEDSQSPRTGAEDLAGHECDAVAGGGRADEHADLLLAQAIRIRQEQVRDPPQDVDPAFRRAALHGGFEFSNQRR